MNGRVLSDTFEGVTRLTYNEQSDLIWGPNILEAQALQAPGRKKVVLFMNLGIKVFTAWNKITLRSHDHTGGSCAKRRWLV